MRTRAQKNRTLALTNTGRLSLFALGCGSAFARTLGQNNYLVVKGDTHLLIDCGTKTPARLRANGVELTDIRNYLVTHSHADHIGGLEEAMLMGRYVARSRPRILIEEAYESVLWNHSLKGGAAPNERHQGQTLNFSDFWDVQRPTPRTDLPRNCAEFVIGTLNVKIFRTNHFPEQARSWDTATYSVGMLFDDTVLFTGDTKFDATLISDFEEHFDIQTIFQDAQFFTGGVHASIYELADLPEHQKTRMHLMHYADSFESKEAEIRKLGFQGFVRENTWYSWP
ncbi:MAG: MBL fold metallo-hydrolase [Spirochaetaceae bacterium]|nr:MAG: MBL fold metallo-hydrolase [Spirochaetaceae bacterium]